MTKKIYFILTALLLMFCGNASAQEFVQNNLLYKVISDEHVTVQASSTKPTGAVTIPETVTNEGMTYAVSEMAEGAFKGCDGITSVTIKAKLPFISVEAFEKCSKMVSINIPSTVTDIRNGAFYNCSALQSITIPASVENMGRSVFYGANALKNITLEDTENCLWIYNHVDSYSYGSSRLFTSDLDKIHIGRPIYRVDDNDPLVPSAKEIELSGWFGNLPAKFSKGNTALVKVTIGNKGDRIESEAFDGCSNLETVNITAPIKYIGTDCFDGCKKLANFVIPSTVDNIDHGAFYNCSSLQSITIPASVENMGRSVFYGANALKNITLEDGENCLWIHNFADNFPYGSSRLFTSDLDKIHIGRPIYRADDNDPLVPSAKEIELSGWFGNLPAKFSKGNTALVKVTIGNKGDRIESEAFDGCSNLESVTITAPIKYIGTECFEGCKKLANFVIPSTVDNIDNGAFYDCSSLQSITIPASVENMGRSVFYGANALKDVTFESTENILWNHNHVDSYPYGSSNLFGSLDRITLGRPFSFAYEGKVFTSTDELVLCKERPSLDGLYTKIDNIKKIIAPWDEPFTLGDDEFTEAVKKSALLLVPYGKKDKYKEANWLFSNIAYAKYKVSMSATVGGKLKSGEIATDGTAVKEIMYERESSVGFEVLPAEDYDFTSLTLNGTAVEVKDGKFAIESLTDDAVLKATFTIKPLIDIVATAAQGKIAIDGGNAGTEAKAQVRRDRNATITVTANEGYYLTAIKVNGVDMMDKLADGKLLIENIKETQNIVAEFKKFSYNVVAAKVENGTITLASSTVEWGSAAVATITPATGYEIATVTVNGVDVTASLKGNEVKIENVRENTTVAATFKKMVFSVVAGKTENGTVTLASSTVEWGSAAVATITPAAGYEVATVSVNGVDVTASLKGNEVKIENVRENTTVTATFKKKTFAVKIKGSGISADNSAPELGADVTLTVLADEDLKLTKLVVDGKDVTASVTADGKYTIKNVQGDVEVVATFISTKEFITLDSEIMAFSCAQDLDFSASDLKAYVASGFNKADGTVLLTRVYDVPANTGIIVKGVAGSTYKIPYAESNAYYVNLLKANVAEDSKVPAETGAMGNYVLVDDEDEQGFYRTNGETLVAAKGAYLQIPTEFYSKYEMIGFAFNDGGSGNTGAAEDVNADGSVDSQDVLTIYEYMKAHAKNRKDIEE